MVILVQKGFLPQADGQQVPQQELQVPEQGPVALSFPEQLEQMCREAPQVHAWQVELQNLDRKVDELYINFQEEKARLGKHVYKELGEIDQLYAVEKGYLVRNYEARTAKLESIYHNELEELNFLYDEKVDILKDERDKRVQAAQEGEPIKEDRDEAITQANSWYDKEVASLAQWYNNCEDVILLELNQKRDANFDAHTLDLKDLKALKKERQEICTRNKKKEIQRVKAKHKQDSDYLEQRIENFLQDENPKLLQKGLTDVNHLINRLNELAKCTLEKVKQLEHEADEAMDVVRAINEAAEPQPFQDLMKKCHAIIHDSTMYEKQCVLLKDKQNQLKSLKESIIKELQARGLPYEFAEAMELD